MHGREHDRYDCGGDRSRAMKRNLGGMLMTKRPSEIFLISLRNMNMKMSRRGKVNKLRNGSWMKNDQREFSSA